MTNNINGHQIQLFDGSFNTGYRIEKFLIAPSTPTSNNEIIAKAHTTPSSTGAISVWSWEVSTEVAWSAWNAPTSSRNTVFELVDPNHLIIEDLYLTNYFVSGDSGDVNYFIELQKYKFPAWTGALGMVQARSQA